MNDDTKPPLPDFAEDDLELQGYQDELDTDDSVVDQATLDETDDPTRTLQIPADEFRDEMEGLVLDSDESNDDIREFVEDADQGDDGPTLPIK